MPCIQLTRTLRMCFDPAEVKQILADCQNQGKTLNECLKETGWDKHVDLLRRHGVVP